MRKERIIEIILNSPRFPQFPELFTNLMYLSTNQNRPQSVLENLIKEHKQQLSSLASCGFFIPSRNKVNLRDSVQILGIKNIRNIVFLNWLHAFSPSGKFDPFDYDQQKRIWCLRSVGAYLLGKEIKQLSAEELFLQSLFLELPLIALARAVPEVYHNLQRLTQPNSSNPKTIERFLGCPWDEFIATLYTRWGIPENIWRPICYLDIFSKSPRPKMSEFLETNILWLVYRLTNYLLKVDSGISFQQLENVYNEIIPHSTQSFISFIRNLFDKTKLFVEAAGYPHSSGFSLIKALKENKALIQRDIIPYEELLDELIEVYRKLELIEKEVQKTPSDSTEILKDSLTGLYNHAYFQESLAKEISRALRYEHLLSVILLDIDDFSLFNQTYGYLLGNSVLMHLAELLSKNVRESDIVARFGGDEFAILLPHTGVIQAKFVAEKLRKSILQTKFPNPFRDVSHQLTVSIALGCYNPRETLISKEEFIQQLLKHLKHAHHEGGNKINSIG